MNAEPAIEASTFPELPDHPETGRLAKLLMIPEKELVSLAAHAGLQAIAERISAKGSLTLPLELRVAGGGESLQPDPPDGMRAVFIREEDYHQVVRAGELVGLKDPANAFVADLIANTADAPGNLLELCEALAENLRPEE